MYSHVSLPNFKCNDLLINFISYKPINFPAPLGFLQTNLKHFIS